MEKLYSTWTSRRPFLNACSPCQLFSSTPHCEDMYWTTTQVHFIVWISTLLAATSDRLKPQEIYNISSLKSYICKLFSSITDCQEMYETSSFYTRISPLHAKTSDSLKSREINKTSSLKSYTFKKHTINCYLKIMIHLCQSSYCSIISSYLRWPVTTDKNYQQSSFPMFDRGESFFPVQPFLITF